MPHRAIMSVSEACTTQLWPNICRSPGPDFIVPDLIAVPNGREDGYCDRRQLGHWLGELPGAGQAKCKGVPHSEGTSEGSQVSGIPHAQNETLMPELTTLHGTLRETETETV